MRKQSRLGSGLAVLLSAGAFGATHFPAISTEQSPDPAASLPHVQLASAVLPSVSALTATSLATTTTTAPPQTTTTTAPAPTTTSTTAVRRTTRVQSTPSVAAKKVPQPTTTTSTVTITTSSVSADVWARLRTCESHDNYTDNTGNGYYGAYQFSAKTWHSLGFSGLPHQAPPEDQDEAARRLQARSGWRQWPACSRQLGLR